jgi:hypothetical protein
MSNPSIDKSTSFALARRVGLAGAAAIVGCATCCVAPVLAAAGLGGSALVATLASLFSPGTEFVVGGIAFTAALGGLTLRNGLRSRATGCNGACRSDASCGAAASAPRLP